MPVSLCGRPHIHNEWGRDNQYLKDAYRAAYYLIWSSQEVHVIRLERFHLLLKVLKLVSDRVRMQTQL